MLKLMTFELKLLDKFISEWKQLVCQSNSKTSFNSCLGIDLGSYKAVMAVVKKGGIDIVLNDASNRQTP